MEINYVEYLKRFDKWVDRMREIAPNCGFYMDHGTIAVRGFFGHGEPNSIRLCENFRTRKDVEKFLREQRRLYRKTR